MKQAGELVGPGLLESSYERALAREMTLRQISFRRQVKIPASYKGDDLGASYRVDFVVESELVVEIKTVSTILAIHRSQLRTYADLLNVRQGLLLNFNAPRLVDGLVSVLVPQRR